jgi:putative membrane protein
MPSSPASVSTATEHRLHPLTVLFQLGRRLWDFIIPLLVALFASSSDRFRLIVAIGVPVVATIAALFEYFTYRYRYADEDLVVRTGLIFRNERHIPYDRIQNIDAVQNMVHRLFNVAVVQVQTGAGREPEATMSVLPISALEEMRARVPGKRRPASATNPAPSAASEPVAAAAATTLLHLSTRELMLAGFIENRGLALVAAGMGALWQIDPLERMMLERIPRLVPAWARSAAEVTADGMVIAVAITTLFVASAILIRLLSTVWALIRLHEFTLTRHADDLRVEYGLFTRVTATIPLRRIQTISIHQRWLHRKFGRAAIRVTTAGASGIPGEAEQADREWLAPIIRTEAVRPLLQQLDPALELERAEWTPAHARAAWRMVRVSSAWLTPLVAATALVIGWWALLVGALSAGYAVLRARGIAKHSGCAVMDERVAFRGGWLHRVVTVARFERIQSASIGQSYFDRRTGMADVAVDTAGIGASGLRMRYLPDHVARGLYARLAGEATRTPFTW